MKNLLEVAIKIAVEAHSGQLDKAGQPYVLHPLRVMFSLSDEKDRIVGVLHDIIEDSNITYDYLIANGFEGETEILEALESVTKKEDETYEEFIVRVALNSIGKRVKLADLEDNMDLSRIPNPTEKDYERIKRYKKARQKLIK
ncbi:(p)ppGpp synthase/HD superfamily hydrolase [Clostridium punense]|uniref:(P)ppGpp synthase/HD superfamily hydrolase n=1 Tax=Clostridium punense TaxID=1054297 RepID=A0ABS4JYG6_9CLOT|nr:guanosine-3',5'-bis(diphosphate) 3'-pyrophosphohydrolase [Clostridium sp. BL8]EQB88452.1 Guanosine-3',5'-bis(Diphosphate) 3'-pyrophosphohydrolase [Clostridium sp. BL8]MBP2020579.1 (p)ppGpp synthase/HD superfamily hydrolase [Clostridium punense]